MRECPVCGDNDYEELAGHFYCRTCNTQSQDVRVEVVDTEVLDGWTGHADVIREKKTPSEKKNKKVVDKGQPWSIYEAYQIILLHQVESLIELGAKPELKSVVFKLWTNYLAHLGVAFTDKGPVHALRKYQRQRELFPGTTKHPKIKNILARSKRRRTVGVSTKQAEKEAERDMVAEALRDEQFDEDDDPLDTGRNQPNDDGMDSNDDVDIDDDAIGLELLDNNRRRALHSMSIYRMQMTYTIALCYLGMMVTNPLTTIVDMVRWMKQERLPYLNVKHLISEDMKFYCNDWKLFGEGKLPTLGRLRWAINTLGSTLRVSMAAIEEFPFIQLLHKYIVQLDLPVEFHQCVVALHRQVKFQQFKRFRLPLWEDKAMALIIVLLKLTFGVNDHSERIFSQYSKELNTLLYGGKQHLFVWDRWIAHVGEKIDIMNKRIRDGDVDEEADIAERLGRRADNNVNKRSIYKLYNSKTRETIQKPFNELTEKWTAQIRRKTGDNSTHDTESVSERSEDVGLDLASNTLLEEDPVGYLLGLNDNEEQELPPLSSKSHKSAQMHKVLERGNTFRQCRLQHILSPDEFLDHCQTGLECDSVADNVEPSSQADRNINIHDSQPVSTSGFDKTKYRSVIEQCVRTKKRYLLAVKPGDTTQEPAAYNWLVHLCSKFIYCKPAVLQAEVSKIEHHLSH